MHDQGKMNEGTKTAIDELKRNGIGGDLNALTSMFDRSGRVFRTEDRLTRTSKRQAKADALQRLPKRAERRKAAKYMGVLPGWREARNRYITPSGQHIVIWPTHSGA